jgi:hypothetical protein
MLRARVRVVAPLELAVDMELFTRDSAEELFARLASRERKL